MSTPTSNLPNYNKTQWGNIPLLTHLNYDSWVETMILVLEAMGAYNIVTGEEPEPQALDIDYTNWKAREAQATTSILLSCSLDVRTYLKGVRSPQMMWHTLQERLDNTTTIIGRTTLLRKFHATRPLKDQPLQDYFNKLQDFRHQLARSIEAISNDELHTHIYTTIPEQYTIMVKIIQCQTPIPTVDEVMDALKEDEGTTAITKEIGDTTTGTALYTQRGSYRG
ncbi:hypothetical protein K440DRAFT_645406 [Wilcoxina mikolae CBS 423.85]|nr:hypothetical protein K440DRAFT_645406 [Wilcoxina mikolae CBS 423.85]